MLTGTQNSASTDTAESAAANAKSSTATAQPVPKALKEREVPGEKPRVLEEVVIEEVSIDGMCGVY